MVRDTRWCTHVYVHKCTNASVRTSNRFKMECERFVASRAAGNARKSPQQKQQHKPEARTVRIFCFFVYRFSSFAHEMASFAHRMWVLCLALCRYMCDMCVCGEAGIVKNTYKILERKITMCDGHTASPLPYLPSCCCYTKDRVEHMVYGVLCVCGNSNRACFLFAVSHIFVFLLFFGLKCGRMYAKHGHDRWVLYHLSTDSHRLFLRHNI